MNDNSLMPYGIHRKKRMIDVPDDYLMWLYVENKHDYEGGLCGASTSNIMDYIIDSFNESELNKQ